ncbi:hypothetical protein ACKUB1_15925 [Methanospirillum stamsii]|uniref:Uncharacterized protein n=1 Tax=Methanospirillum stamsii TaxID=1277351 RepID=A0A2V2N861_9EURY|nr:hypothetical protein [Methanospirillum stamsii]PWR71761.1 hypothetical protein DLD82_13505 [Methanospirillum stamsii]
MKKKDLATLFLVIWVLIILTFMLMGQYLDLEIFFVLWLIGLLIITELISTHNIQTKYLVKIKYVIAIGVAIFAFIVLEKVMVIINS